MITVLDKTKSVRGSLRPGWGDGRALRGGQGTLVGGTLLREPLLREPWLREPLSKGLGSRREPVGL